MLETKFRFGKNSRIEIAQPVANTGAEPADGAAWLVFCLTNSVKIGLSKGSITINNFCTGGDDVEVPDGSSTGKVEFGDTTWTEDDPALKILEDAAFSQTEIGSKVYYRIYPLGKTEGYPVYRGIFNVTDWEIDVPSKGEIKVTNGPKAQGAPERGTVGAQGAFTPIP